MLQILCLLAAVSLFAQTKAPVIKFYAYVQETFAGNIEVDENGNPLGSGTEKIHFLYADVIGKVSPQWKNVFTKDGSYAIQAEPVSTGKISVGERKSDGKELIISAKRGATLWKLELVPVKIKMPSNIEKLLKKNQLVIITSFRNRQILHIVAKEIELQPVYYK